MDEQIHWLGHAAVRITGCHVIYVDPFRIDGGMIADYILITHSHYDHCSPDDIRKVMGERTVIIAPPDCLSQLPAGTRYPDTLRNACRDSRRCGTIQISVAGKDNSGHQGAQSLMTDKTKPAKPEPNIYQPHKMCNFIADLVLSVSTR